MTEVPRFWRLKGQLLRLEGSNCQGCGIKHFPPRTVCPDCGLSSTKIEPKVSDKKELPENKGSKERL
ncbi:MAG: hypothetical protein KatS3mg088_408 [Patescibacteria group bacterium]|nr:MAG: hypothetical protein KatS3mg088_408 [Patescibacteria group bacterium]